jgi:hypothetical protein
MLRLAKKAVWTIQLILLLSVVESANAAYLVTLQDRGCDSAILFVHGLEESAGVSFTDAASGYSWKDLILGDTRPIPRKRSLSMFDIYSVDYSDVFQGVDIVSLSVEEMATQVATALQASKLLEDYNHIWIVAHSLGGIIIKRVVARWSGARSDRYLDRIVGISFLGVPSNGAPLANIGSSKFTDVVRRLLGFNSQHISDLRTIENMNTFLKATETDWTIFLSQRHASRPFPRISCAYETMAQYKLAVIVPELYTKTICAKPAQPIVKPHIELPKPAQRDDPIQDWLFDAVREGFLLLDGAGEQFEQANAIGALWTLVNHINSGHQRLEPSTGIPVIDQSVAVSDEDMLKLKELRLVGSKLYRSNLG